MSFRPRLRPDVTLQAKPDGQVGNLHDGLVGRDIGLGVIANAAARRFDGRTVDEIADELGAFGSREQVARAVRMMLLLNLLEGSGDGARARLARVVRGEFRPPHAVLEGSRFECQGSGQCCQNYNLGPLTDADIARLEALDIAKHFPEVGPPPYHVETERHRFLRTVDDRCIFLQGDAKCGIHAKFGAEAKPGLCRIYPLEQLATIDGIKLYDKGSCAEFARSSRRGLPLADQLPSVEPLLQRKHSLYHPVVLLEPATCCDYAHFLRILRAQGDVARSRRGTPPERLRAAGRLLVDATAALASCPLGPGEPEPSLERALVLDPERLFAAPSDDVVARGRAILATVAAELLEAAANIIPSPTSSKALSARLAREIAQLLHIVHALATGADDPYAREIAAQPFADAADTAEVLTGSMRQQLFGFHALIDDKPLPALLRMAFVQLCALTGARLRATVEGTGGVRADDLSYGHMLATRVLDLQATTSVLLDHEDDAALALEALPSLCGWAS